MNAVPSLPVRHPTDLLHLATAAAEAGGRVINRRTRLGPSRHPESKAGATG